MLFVDEDPDRVDDALGRDVVVCHMTSGTNANFLVRQFGGKLILHLLVFEFENENGGSRIHISTQPYICSAGLNGDDVGLALVPNCSDASITVSLSEMRDGKRKGLVTGSPELAAFYIPGYNRHMVTVHPESMIPQAV